MKLEELQTRKTETCLHSTSRRGFCGAVAAGAATVALPGCFSGTGGGGYYYTGDAGPGDARAGNPDFAAPRDAGGSPDLPQPSDLAQGGNCPPSVTDTFMDGAAFALDTATFFVTDNLFICRDAGGLYALTAVCTHAGCSVEFSAGSRVFNCPCHGSQFTFNGAVRLGPAGAPLSHLALCRTDNGTVAYDAFTPVAASTRYNF